MKKISLWASQHIFLSRFFIITSHLLLTLLAFIIADILPALHISYKGKYFYSIVIIIAALLYPDKKERQRYKNFYQRQKILDFVLVFFGFLLMISLFTGFQQKSASGNITTLVFANVTVRPAAENTNIKKQKAAKQISKKSFRKALKNQIAKFRKEYKETSKAGKILLIILLVFVASGLAAGVAAWSCSLSCSGSEALSIVVLIFGMGGIIFGSIKAIQAILRKRKNSKALKVEATSEN